jgi:hypothetical protein
MGRVDNEERLSPLRFLNQAWIECQNKLDFPRRTTRLGYKYLPYANGETSLRDRVSPD